MKRTSGVLVALAVPIAAFAQLPVLSGVNLETGEAVYREHCAACHDSPQETRSPGPEALRGMGPRAIAHTLTDGRMREQGAPLSPAQIDAVAGYLSRTSEIDDEWIAAHLCPRDRGGPDTGDATVAGVGIDPLSHRNLDAASAGLTREQLSRLEPAWALGFPQTSNMRAQPAIVGTTVYLPIADSGQLFALDIDGPPCVHWLYDHGLPLRTAVNYGRLDDGRAVLVFGDGAAHVQMLEAASGELLWRTSLRVTSVSNTTAMPMLHQGRVYAPVSSGELNMGAAPDYECCTSHGAVAALEAETGEVVWLYRTMEQATPRGVNRVGTRRWGPSGAPIWTSPTIDAHRGLLYVGTGQNTSEPPTDTSDAVLALNLDDGELRWKFQATENDIFLTGCMFAPDGPNCPPDYSVNADWDFGAPMIIANRPDGRDVLLAGQKSGELWALDPDDGELLWQVKVGPGGPAGGIHWGMAYDGQRVYVPVNKVGIPLEEDGEPGLHAIDVETGEIAWSWLNAADCSGDRRERIGSCDTNYGLSAAALLIDGAVVQGGNDGFLRIFDGADGTLLYALDTAREFDTVNGVPARGGAIDNASVIAAHGLLLVQSGYGLLGAPGNVLLALRPRPDGN